MSAPRPAPPPLPTATQLPPALAGLRRWIGFKIEPDAEDPEKLNKVPHSAMTGATIGSTPVGRDGQDYASHWQIAADALAGAVKFALDGVGFIFNTPYGQVGEIGIDFDGVVVDGEIVPAVKNLLRFFPSYKEYSVSGRGVHVVCRGKINRTITPTPLPGGVGKVEVYCQKRYFTFTGNRIGDFADITDCQGSIDRLLDTIGANYTTRYAEPGTYRPMRRSTARKIHDENISALKDSQQGQRNSLLNTTAFFAGGCYQALEGTPEQIQQQLLTIITEVTGKRAVDRKDRDVIESAWASGAARPIEIREDNELEITVDDLNEKFFVIKNLGGKCRVGFFESEVHEELSGCEKLVHQGFEDFSNGLCNQQVQVGVKENGEPRFMAKGKMWLSARHRREYWKVVFYPERDAGPDNLNLWRGFAYTERRGDCSKYLEHVRKVICSENQDHFEYLVKWLARAVQKPWERGHTAVVLRGDKGAGKNVFVDAFGRLFGPHFMTITHSEHLTGRFNAHLRAKSVLLANECFYAGNKQDEATLKALISDGTLPIEQKFVDPESDVNLLHLIVLSNHDWVVPASDDERRYFMMDVSGSRIRDFEYFKAIRRELENGGYEALLHHLKSVDLDGFEVRDVPETAALRSQMNETMSGVEAAWFECLVRGEIPARVRSDGTAWMRASDFVSWASRQGRRDWATISATKLGLLLGDNPRGKKHGMGWTSERLDKHGPRGWVAPTLAESRERWRETRSKWTFEGGDDGWVSVLWSENEFHGATV